MEGIFSVHSRLVTQYPGLLLLLKCIHNIHGNKDNVYTINQNKIRQRSQLFSGMGIDYIVGRG